MTITSLAKGLSEKWRRVRATGLPARRSRVAVVVAAALAALLYIDPFGTSSLIAAVLADPPSDGDLSRSERVDAVMDGLNIASPVAATTLTGSWDALPAIGDLSEVPADPPTEDEQVVVLGGEGDVEPTSFTYSASASEDPEPGVVDLGGMTVAVAAVDPEAAPDAVLLRVAGETETAAAGVTGVLLEVSDASEEAVESPEVELTVSYATFAGLVGGDWASRLRVLWIPDCGSEALDCAPVPIESVNDPLAQTVTAIVPVGEGEGTISALSRAGAMASTGEGGGGSLAVTADASGSSGDWGATSLSQSATWGAGGSTGSFTWSLPFTTPAVPAGPTPQLGLSYSSAASDGRTPNSNNQSGLVGEGFDVTSSYVERSYVPCSQDEEGAASNVGRVSGDLCWGTENATLVFNGSAVDLIHDVATNTWHSKSEDGSLVEKLTGAWNGGQQNEYWKVTTTGGVQYYFGRGQRSSADTTALNSAWTVPVYGNHSGEPCYNAAFSASQCNQVWRWNLEYVVDPSGNSMTYFYSKESNSYVYDLEGNNDLHIASYTSGGRLDRIEYGTRESTEASGAAPAKVIFGTSPRCITDLATPDSWCTAAQNATNANNWLDTPTDLICSAEPCSNYTPVFFDRYRLNEVSTFGFDGTAYQPVDSWSIQQAFVASGTGGLEWAASPMLITTGVTHTGKGGTSATADDLEQWPTQFGYAYLDNRVDSTADGVDPMRRPRISDIRTETGASITVNYRTECSSTDKPGTSETDQQANTKLCYPVKWSQSEYGDAVVEYFHKYVVDTIVESGAPPADGDELITGSVAMQTSYTYSGGAAWAKPTGAMVKPDEVSFSDFRGFGDVTTTNGVGAGAISSRALYYRGLGGTLTGGPAGYEVTAVDHLEFRGEVFDAFELNGTDVLTETIATHGDPEITATDAAGNTAARVPSDRTYSFTFMADGVLEFRTQAVTLFDAFAQPVSIEVLGDLSVTTDDICKTNTYAHATNSTLASKHLVALVSQTDTVSGNCSDTPDLPEDLVASSTSTFDDFGRVVESKRIDPSTGVGYVLTSKVLSYDAWGRSESVQDAVGNVSTMSYEQSAGGLPLSITSTTPDPDGPTGPLSGFETTTNLNPFTGMVLSTSDANGYVTSGTYDSLGRRLTAVFPEHAGLGTPSVQYEYITRHNGLNSVVTKTLAADGVTQRASVSHYDGLLRLFQTQVESLDAGADHDATAAERGRLVSQTYYGSAGQVVNQTGQWLVAGAPDSSPVAAEPVPPSHTTFMYDSAGRVIEEIFWVGTESLGSNKKWSTTTHYDGALTLTIPPVGGTPQSAKADALGRTVELRQYLRDPDTSAGAEDALEVLDLPSQLTTYTYNAADERIAMHDPEGNEWTFDFDFAGRLISASDPDAGTSTTTYDALDRVATHTDGNGQVLSYTYDHIGRTTELRDGATLRVKWVFDTATDPNNNPVLGQLFSATRYVDGNEYKTTVSRYDFAGRPLATTVTLPNIPAFAAVGPASGEKSFTTGYTYAADGQMASLSLPAVKSGAVTYLGAETLTTRFDTASMPSWMGGGFGWGVYVAESRFAADGRPLLADLGNTYGTITSYQYENGTERLQNVSLYREGYNGTDLNIVYGYDAAGNVTSMSDRPSNLTGVGSQDNQCFAYDGLNQLELAFTALNGDCAVAQDGLEEGEVGGAQPYWNEYEYDPLGNRTKLVQHGLGASQTTTTDYAHGGVGVGPHQVASLSRLSGETTTTADFEYDDAGNRVSSGDAELTWDAEGELVTLGDESYVYDAAGSRLVRTDSSGTTVYLPGGQEILISGSTVTAARYYSFDGKTIATRTGSGLGAVTSLVSDAHGSVVAAVPNTVSTASSVARIFSDPFGATRGGSDADLPGDHRFLGAVRDGGSGLTLLGARYYDEAVGQFISVDPLMDASMPGHFNAYAYSLNNPMTFSDPSGLRPAPEEPFKIISSYTPSGSSFTYPEYDTRGSDGSALEEAGEGVEDLLKGLAQNPEGAGRDGWTAFGFFNDNGILHTRSDSWQLRTGYMGLYDTAIDSATDILYDQYPFMYEGQWYTFWVWKGDYLNMGAGAEIGFYRGLPSSLPWDVPTVWTTDTGYTPKMSVDVKLNGERIATSNAGLRVWVGVWNSHIQDAFAKDVTPTYTVNLADNQGMYDAFKGTYEDRSDWQFSGDSVMSLVYDKQEQ